VTLPYLFRLLCLSLASLFLIHLALGLIVSLISPTAIRLADRTRPRWAARFLLILRLLPSGLSLFVVAALCIPSYFKLEPETTSEQVGIACFVAALLGLIIWGISITRAVRASAHSLRYIRHCGRIASRRRSPIWVIEGAGHVLALAGVLRPRLVVSRDVVSALSPHELSAALRHERAHQTSRDNLKRLFMLLTPDILPFFRGHESLERAWSKFTEWAADDTAVAGNPRRSLALAAALVRVARLGASPQPTPLMTSLLGGAQDLSARVDRLLHPAPQRERKTPVLIVSTSLLLCASLVAAVLQPSTFHSVHQILEHLIR
jgi:beta-lactamase regulating signal transducer with metallopeptidase domain